MICDITAFGLTNVFSAKMAELAYENPEYEKLIQVAFILLYMIVDFYNYDNITYHCKYKDTKIYAPYVQKITKLKKDDWN